MDDREMM